MTRRFTTFCHKLLDFHVFNEIRIFCSLSLTSLIPITDFSRVNNIRYEFSEIFPLNVSIVEQLLRRNFHMQLFRIANQYFA